MSAVALTAAFIAAGAYLRARRLQRGLVVLGQPIAARRAETDSADVATTFRRSRRH